VTQQPAWTRTPAGYTAGLAGLAVLYYLFARVSLSTAIIDPSVTAAWAPAGLSLAVLLIAGYRLWPAILVGAFFAHAGTEPVVAALGIATGSTLTALLATFLVNRFANGRSAFRRARDVLAWCVYAGLLCSAIGATIAVASLAIGRHIPWSMIDDLWITRWLGNVASVTVLAPAIVLWWSRPTLRWSRRQVFEGITFLVTLLAAIDVVFGVPLELGSDHRYPRAFIFFPVMAWAAFRLGTRTTTAMLLLVSGLSIWGTLMGRGPFTVGDMNDSMLLLMAFLITTAVTTLAVAAGVDERQRAQRQVGVLNAELQQRVGERTTALARSEALLIEAQSLRQRAQAEEERARFLAEASSVLSASLDYETTLDSLARLAVPRIADWCSVQLLGDDGSIEQIALAHVDPQRMAEVQALVERWPPDPESPYGVQEVIRTGRAQMVPAISDDMLVTSARSEEHLAFMRSLHLHSFMMVPLKARGHVIGAITLVTTAGGRTYDEGDVVLADELATRAATAVENTRLFARVQEAVRVREDFLAIASHELRTPVTSLRLQVQIVERSLAEQVAKARVATDPFEVVAGLEQVLSYTGVLGEDSRRLVRLVNGLLDVTRIATGKLDLQLEDLDFREIVKSGIDAMRPELTLRKVKLSFRAPEPLPGRWDRLRIEQVVANLLSNAVKYGGGTPITVLAESQGDEEVVLTVQDQGAGIAPEFRARMFDRFEQGASGTQGLGLGLYITRQIVQSHGGSIDGSSPPGEGATFTVRLPRITEPVRRTPGKEGAA
jgi:signal transduction histidine kinase/integral membrane sensor domain MASE1